MQVDVVNKLQITVLNGASRACKSSALNLLAKAVSLPSIPSANAALRACRPMMRSSMLPSTNNL